MKTLYESILDDNIEDQYSPDQLLIKKTVEWLNKYIPRQNVSQRLSINDGMVDMNGTIEIPKRTTLLPKGIKLGNVAYFCLEDPRYFDRGLLPKHSDIFDAKHCQRPKTDIIINCSQAIIGNSLSMNNNVTINIEDSKMVKLLPGSIWFDSLPPSTSIKHIKFNSNNKPVYILWESFTMIEESIPDMLENFFTKSKLKYILSKQQIKKLVKKEIFKRIKIDEINKYWPEVQTIWFVKGISWLQDDINIANDLTKIQSQLELYECCIFRKGNDWDVIYKN